MVNDESNFDEEFDFDENKDGNSINAILNDQQESKMNILRNLLIIILIVGAGIGVFWGSFVLGKKVFTASAPQPKQVSESVKIAELSDYDMPDEKVLYEIEQIDENKARAAQASANPAVATPSQTPAITTPAIVQPSVQPVAKVESAPPPTKTDVKVVQLSRPAPKPVVETKPVFKTVPLGAKKSDPVIKVTRTDPVKREIKAVPVRQAPKVEAAVETAGKKYKVIAGSYSKEENAKILGKKLQDLGFDVFLANVNIKGVAMWRVQIGAYDKAAQARSMILKVKATGNDAFYVLE